MLSTRMVHCSIRRQISRDRKLGDVGADSLATGVDDDLDVALDVGRDEPGGVHR